MKRQIIKIDKEKCNGCGLCVKACHEGAIGMKDGKAVLLRDDYCDGLGDCLPACPVNAISFEQREAAAYNEAEVKANMEKKKIEESKPIPHGGKEESKPLPCGCPGTHSKQIIRKEEPACPVNSESNSQRNSNSTNYSAIPASRLNQWPVQIKLVPVNAPYFNGANLLIAADCTAFAYGDFHNEFIKNHVTLIGCPKLDMPQYVEKLTEIIKNNDIKSVKIVRMEVPCCGGIENAAKQALLNSGKFLPWQVYTISTDGRILDR